MNPIIKPKSPKTRCYKCGEADIAFLCHECGLAIGESQGPATPPYQSLFVNQEYEGLGLSKQKSESAHCEACLHYVWSKALRRWAIGIACLLAVLSAWLISRERAEIGLETFVLAMLVFACYLLAELHVLFQRHFRRPPFPIIGKLLDSKLRERMHGSISLDREGHYFSTVVGSPLGELITSYRFTQQDKDRVRRYQKKYWPFANDAARISYHAGFVIIEGEKTPFGEQQANKWRKKEGAQGHIYELSGTLAEYPYLNFPNHTQDPLQTITASYRNENKKKKILPIQILPQLEGSGEEIGISLIIQKNPQAKAHDLNFQTFWIEDFSIELPVQLGRLVECSPQYEYKLVDGTPILSWTGIRGKSIGLNTDKKHFYLQLKRNKEQLDQEIELVGKLKVSFEGTYSKINYVKYFHPMGMPRHPNETPETEMHAVINVDYCLNLSSLKAMEYSMDEEVLQGDGLVPNHQLMTELTAAFIEHDIYMKQVIEHPASLKEGNAALRSHLWDLQGRKYYGVYPIDIFIVLTGITPFRPNYARRYPIQFAVKLRAPSTNRDATNLVAQFKSELMDILKRFIDPYDDDPPGDGPPDGGGHPPANGNGNGNGKGQPNQRKRYPNSGNDDFVPPSPEGGGNPAQAI